MHLIYKNKSFEGHYKDYEFSNDTMREHWASGLEDIRRSFGHPDWFEIPSHDLGFVTHDVHRYEAPPASVGDEAGGVPREPEPADEVDAG